MAELRLAALRDPHSTYYTNICKIICRAQEDERRVVEGKIKVVIPFKVPEESIAEYQRRFGWRIVVENHGLRSAFSPHVAGLTYCMAMRNMLTLGRDGEELIALDADLPALVAKGAAYVKAVRTNSSDQLQASYRLEENQLVRLSKSRSQPISGAAKAMLEQLKAGGGARVVLSSKAEGIRGDVLLIDHTRTSVSLAQAVVTAKAWGATAIRGVCFFQPEMLVYKTGRLSAFPGEYVIDELDDIITYVPDGATDTRFSHCWSSLRSFFLNHECVMGNTTWLVEKHLGKEGIFHYVARLASEPWEFPVALGANYYSANQTEWVEVSFPTRGTAGAGASSLYWRRDSARIPKYMYDNTMAALMAVDVKNLTKEQVLLVMRNLNNTAVVGGDTVKVPERVWANDIQKIAVPMLAQAVHRRAAASAELSKLMSVLRKRYGSISEGALSLVWEVFCNGVDYLKAISVGLATEQTVEALDSLVRDGVDLRVLAKQVPASIEVVQIVGASVVGDYGGFIPQLPTNRVGLVDRMLAKARAFAAKRPSAAKFSVVTGESEVEEESSGVSIIDKDVNGDKHDSGYAVGSLPGLSHNGPGVSVVECVVQTALDDREREGVAGKLFDKLQAEQDAVTLIRPPREVHTFEGLSRPEGYYVPVALADPALMQDDYDDGMPGVSLVDAEAIPYIAAESELSVVRQSYMSINDAKRTLPRGKMIRRAKARGGAAGMLPRSQAGLFAALGKRNLEVPTNRGFMDFEEFPAKCVERIRQVCFVDNWKDILNRELDTGLWQPNESDLKQYVDKVDTAKAEAMLKEFFSISDVDMRKWIVMTKAKAKPPVDEGAASKVPLPQTIMYNESKSMNALYSSIMSRFHDTVDAMCLPGVSFNARHSPAKHEVWFNSIEPVRRSCKRLYRYQGDTFNFDRSLEYVAFAAELNFYREHGLDAATLERWKTTMGVKKAVSLMHGIIIYIVLQGLSGIFKTLFRNGLVTWMAALMCTDVSRESLISLDIKGDDYTLETNAPIDTSKATEAFAWGFNFSAKFFESDYLHFCSKYWLYVDNWWYWVADPERKYESVCAAVVVDDQGEDKLSEKWISLKDDLRHYDNALVVEELARATMSQGRRSRPPVMLISGLTALALDRDRYFAFYGPAERVG